MKRTGMTALFALIGLLLLGVGFAQAQGLYFETKRSGRDTPSMKVSYMPGMAKVVTSSGHIVLLRIDKEVVNIMNPKNKTFTEVSFDDLENRNLNNLTPEQKRALEGRNGAGKNQREGRADDREVVKTDETKTINGFTCTKYEIRTDGKVTETVWATDEVKSSGALRKDIEKLLDRAGSLTAMSQPLTRLIGEVEGFPVQIQGRNATTMVTNIKEQSIPESEFQVPSGYTRANQTLQGGASDTR